MPDENVAVIVITLDRDRGDRTDIMDRRTLLVFDVWRIDPKWKFVAGHVEKGEIPVVAAQRENSEEGGIFLPLCAYRHFHREISPDHVVHYFVCESDLNHAPKYGDEDGRPLKIRTDVTLRQIWEGNIDFLPDQLESLRAIVGRKLLVEEYGV